jgi:hypothetical protein
MPECRGGPRYRLQTMSADHTAPPNRRTHFCRHNSIRQVAAATTSPPSSDGARVAADWRSPFCKLSRRVGRCPPAAQHSRCLHCLECLVILRIVDTRVTIRQESSLACKLLSLPACIPRRQACVLAKEAAAWNHQISPISLPRRVDRSNLLPINLDLCPPAMDHPLMHQSRRPTVTRQSMAILPLCQGMCKSRWSPSLPTGWP